MMIRQLNPNLVLDEVSALLDKYLSEIGQSLVYSVVSIIPSQHQIIFIHWSIWCFHIVIRAEVTVWRTKELVEPTVEGQVVRPVTHVPFSYYLTFVSALWGMEIL